MAVGVTLPAGGWHRWRRDGAGENHPGHRLPGSPQVLQTQGQGLQVGLLNIVYVVLVISLIVNTVCL